MSDAHDANNIEKVKWSLEESIELINLVKKQPALYDMQDKRFRLFKFTESIWTGIDIELQKPPGASKERWGHLRITFRKEYMEKKEQSKWKLYNHMLFVSKYLYKKGPSLDECISAALGQQKQKAPQNNPVSEILSSTLVMEDPDPVRASPTAENELINLQYSFVEMEEPNFASSNPIKSEMMSNNRISFPLMTTPVLLNKRKPLGTSNIEHHQIKLRKLTPDEAIKSKVSTANLKIVPRQSFETLKTTEINHLNISRTVSTSKNTIDMNPCTCNADHDVMFMQSLLPDVKKLEPEKSILFKIKTQQLLGELLYGSK